MDPEDDSGPTGDAGAEWYAVRCVFRGGDEAPFVYEERLTLWRAGSFDEAIALAEAEAEAAEYTEDISFQYAGLAQAYRLVEPPGHGTEVYSLMRDSDLPPEEYLTRFFDTGEERQGGSAQASS
ncbi:hypothetical protein [Micromonospora siamensis]|uniref:DUF4288 domain-containing protein n=1 Tax=Micromonospora siamensis TaxID=299152 RepID=A0A1C5IV66_9ACTN|nr:hypothetical protein [Micromonospora siamensis]SCG62248.1 hypothetical protein GA0074704_3851 [Micromonospora siamensis]